MKPDSSSRTARAVPGSEEEPIICHYFDQTDPEGCCRALEKAE